MNPPTRLSPGVISKSLHALDNSYLSSETKSINEKAAKYFKKNFHHVNNLMWSHVGENLLAQFSTGETKSRLLFNKKGNLIYSIVFYNEEELPGDIQNIVRDFYQLYTITSVAKVEEDNRQIWVVKLSGKSSYVTARVENDEIEEVENFRKGD